MFDPLLEELHKSIEVRGGESISVPQDLKEYQSANGKSLIRNWLWKVPGFRRWRVTRLDAGNKLQVLNSVAYPDYVNDQPLMGIDLLWFGTSCKLVAILDFQPLHQDQGYFDRHFTELQVLRSRFPEFCEEAKMRSFDPDQYFSPWLLFCRGGIDEAKVTLPVVFTAFLSCYWNLNESFTQNSSKISVPDVKRLQNNYDIYSAERDPAHGLFCSYFGHTWTEHFLRNFLFPGV